MYVKFRKLSLIFDAFRGKGFIFALLLLFSWYIYSLIPFPFVQCSDGYFTTIPRIMHVIGEILNGRIPLWNEYQFCGITLLADGNTMFLNLITIFYFFMEPLWAYTAGTVFLFLTLIIGTWIYFRERGFSKTASLIGTIGYVYGGQVLFWSLYHGMNLSLTLFPLTLFTFRRFEKTGEIRWKILAFILMFFSAVGGFIQFSIIAIVSSIIEGIDDFSFRCIKKVLRERGIAALLALFSAAFIIMPTIEAGIFSHRRLCESIMHIYPSPTIINEISLNFWGTSFGKHGYPNYFYYIGIILIALSIFSIRKCYKKILLSPYFIYSFIFPFILVFVYFGILPRSLQLGIESDPWRYMFIFILSLSLLSAKGADIAIEHLKTTNRLILPPFELLIAGLISICIGLYKIDLSDYKTVLDRVNTIILGCFVLLGFISSFILNRKGSSIKIIVFSFWLVLLLIINSFCPSYKYLKTNVIHDEHPIMNPWEREKLPINTLSCEGRFIELREDRHICLEEWGIYSKIRALGGGSSLLHGSIFLKMINDGLLPPRPSSVSHFKVCNILNPDILAKYGVLYLLKYKEVSTDPTQEGWQFYQKAENYLIYKNPKYVGRSYVIDKEENIIKGANIVKNTSSYIKISVDADIGDILILADSWYPGWECYDNGKKVKGFNVAGFRGYDIKEKGYHEVEWIYKPMSLYIGLIMSGISLFTFFFLILLNKFKMK